MINLEEFLKLPGEEKRKRYSELTPDDQLLARMSNWSPEDTICIKVSDKPEDIEKQKKMLDELKRALEQGEMNLL